MRLGPGILVAAAFIGPGTVTTASLAGANFGFGLFWALILSVLATLLLQEMAMRVGLVTRLGLSEVLAQAVSHRVLRWLVAMLIVVAIGFGNAAYEAGNLIGAVLGAGELLAVPDGLLLGALAGLAAALLASGRYRLLETVLIALVAVMALVFLTTAVLVPPDIGQLFVTSPLIHEKSHEKSYEQSLTVIALIGTTVVPYNLFLQASAVRERWPQSVPLAIALREARRDTVLSVSLGGLVTLAIMSTAAVAFFGQDAELTVATLAQQLEPTLGAFARPVFALGLLAAGLTSAITAPLAAAWALTGALGWRGELQAPGFRLIWATVLGVGTALALLDIKPITAILLAQASNGLLLPVIAVLLLWVANSRGLLGDHRNGWFANLAGGLAVVLVAALGLYRLWGAVS